MCVCVCVCVCVCAYVSACVRRCCMYKYVQICVYVQYVQFLCVLVCVCLHACVCAFLYLHVCHLCTIQGYDIILLCIYSETSLIQHLYNPTFSLIRPLYEVQSPYISMVRGTP